MKKFNFKTLLLAIGLVVASAQPMWANDGDFYEVYYYYQKNDGSDVGVQCLSTDSWSKNPIEMEEITSTLKITKMYFKVWDDWGSNYNWNWGQLIYSYDNMLNKSYFKVESKSSRSGNNYQFQNENCNLVLARSTDNSGKYTITYCWQGNRQQGGDKYIDDGSGNNYHIKYTILPPAVFQYACNVTGAGSGTGSSGNPYKVAKGSKLTITITGSNQHSIDNTDSNSQTQVSWDGGSNWGTTMTKEITVNDLTQQSISVWTRNYNSSASLSSSEVKKETIYYIGTEDPTISLGVSTPEIDLGQTITLTPTPGSVSAGGQTYAYQYSTDGGSSWTDIISGQTAVYVWSPSAAGDYKVRIVMTYQSNTYTSNVVDVKVYDVYTIKISPKWFAYIYLWNSSTRNAEFPGVAVSGEQIGGWYVMQVSSKWEHMIVSDDNSTSRKQSETIDLTSSKCYTLSSAGEGTTWGTTEATCPEAPTTTTNDPTSIQNTSVTLNGTVASNNEALTDYGFYWGTTEACDIKVQVGESDKNDSYTKSLTGLTANTTYYYKAYATNAFGTTYGNVKSFTTKYEVTISAPTNGKLSQTGTIYIDAAGIQITATPNTGYSFTSWTNTNCELNNQTWDGKTNTITLVPTADNATLSATFTEDKYTITISAGANGSVANAGEYQLGVVGQSFTATPDPGYYFVNWTTTGGASVANATSATTKVTATATGTVTANFAERYVFRGSINGSDDTHGMPGWDNQTPIVFTDGVGSVSYTLEPNTTYKLKLRDKSTESGYAGYQQTGYHLNLDGNYHLFNGSNDVLFTTQGYGLYTFTVSFNGSTPQMKAGGPESYVITMAPKAFTNNQASSDPSFGGQLTAQTQGTIDETLTTFNVTTGQYVCDGGSVVFTATPKTGYTFAGFYSNAECTDELQAASSGTTYTISNIQENKAVYAKFTENLTPVTLKINGDGKVKVGDVEKTDGTIFNVGVYTTVTFTTVNGSSTKFNGWTLSAGADFHMEENTLKGNGAGSQNGQILTANFGELDKIYFLNKKFGSQYKWTDVYFYWDAYWTDTYGAGAHDTEDKPSRCAHMTNIAGTDIWWAYVPSGFNGSNIAFSEENMWNYKNFNKVNNQESHGVYRTDYNKKHNMYVPVAGSAVNECYYFSEGYWMKYNPEASEGVGYYLKKSDYQFGEFQASEFDTQNGTLTSTITISVDENETQYIYVVSAGAENYADENAITKEHKSTVLSKYKENPSLGFTPNGTGDYTFRLIQGNGLNMSIEVDFPNVDDAYRVVYNNGTKDHPSHAIQPNDKVSFFVNKTNGKFRIQQFTGGTWTNVIGATNLDVPGTVENDGVYVFQLADDGKSLTNLGAYTGNYYIRTDRAGGGWHNYKGNENNLMVKGNIYGYNNTYDYAYTNWAGPNTNVKYTVANDYSICLSDSLEQGDEVIGENVQKLGDKGANIRFMWDSKTNNLRRDYIGGSNDDDEFLLIHGSDNAAAASRTKSKLYETAEATSPVDKAKFHDDGNWIYSKEVYVEPGAYTALTAHFNNKTQFFYGEGDADEGTITTYEQFVGGSGTNRLKMKVIYNFKTNELVAGYMPDDSDITSPIDLNSDLLWIRTQQGEATPINFTTDDAKIENIHKIYGVLELCKDSMTNLYKNAEKIPLTNTSYDRINYWISFPFDVKISDIFGIDGYGEKWVIQYYNGEKRAEIGWFAETSTFWEWLDIDDVMYAGKGYTLNLNTTYFDEATDDVWKNVESKVAFYFPSTETKIGVIKQQEVTTKIPDHAYQYDRYFGEGKNHRETDSYWNIIGTPAFQKTTISTASSDKKGPKAVYVWKQGKDNSNGYDIKETMTDFTFKPMRSYIVQYGGEVTWEAVSSIVKATAPYAYADQKNYLIDLEFYFGEQRDHTYINLSDEATKDFKLNEDVMKMTNSKEPNIYSYAEGYDVAYNEVPMVNQTINLGVIARKNGTYTFSMPKDFSGSAILVDLEEGTFTDLNVSNYSVDLNKGTYNNRFQLMLEVEAKIPTNIENANGGLWSEDGKTQKLLINDQIYLINAGRIYNATGTKVK